MKLSIVPSLVRISRMVSINGEPQRTGRFSRIGVQHSATRLRQRIGGDEEHPVSDDRENSDRVGERHVRRDDADQRREQRAARQPRVQVGDAGAGRELGVQRQRVPAIDWRARPRSNSGRRSPRSAC